MSGPATNTRATEMRHRGPVLKERKKIVKNVGRAKKCQKSSWRAGKYEWVQSGGLERTLWDGSQISKDKKEVIFSPVVSYWKDRFFCLAFL